MSTSSMFSLGIAVDRRKRLGQYFTGAKLAKLLCMLANGERSYSAVDPMCGSGDMLLAVKDMSPLAQITGLDIDPLVLDLCRTRLAEGDRNKTNLVQGNVFDWATIAGLPSSSFDLVITNPPYVRYQQMAGNGQDGMDNLPDAETIRKGLLEIAENLQGLGDQERHIFTTLIREYSGLSDLAVPSWILCAMLTSVGGKLAMVVPESWLTRDYANPIHYLLVKLFRIQYVIEDEHSIWFDEALVKTNLLVAERIHPVSDIREECAGKQYLHVTLPKSTIDARSIVGNLYPDAQEPETVFVNELQRLHANDDIEVPNGYKVTKYSLAAKVSNLIATSARSAWLKQCEPLLVQSVGTTSPTHDGAELPQSLIDLLSQVDPGDFTTLECLGWKIGQGLRTGANQFFYCERISVTGENCLINPSRIFGLPNLLFPANALLPVLRKQNEAPETYRLDRSKVQGRVLMLEDFIHPDDLQESTDQCRLAPTKRQVMPPALTTYVAVAKETNIGTKEQPKWIPELSAVRTNVSKPKGDREERYWYMLPSLANRHVPDLFVPRVNHLHPKVMMNSPEKVVIDANFSTLWAEQKAKIDAFSILSCLNSTWSIAAMELNAAVMGGGALKLEATHLRRLPVPMLSDQSWTKLSELGKKLVSAQKTSEILDQIDQIMAEALFGLERAHVGLQQLKMICNEKRRARMG